MVKNLKKISLSLLLIVISIILVSTKLVVKANDATGEVQMLHELDPSSNFFTQVQDKTLIDIVDKREELILDGYEKICENSNLELYFKEATCGIAIFDKQNGYTWYSTNPNMDDYDLSSAIRQKIESGVTIEYYFVDSKKAIKSAELYYTATEVDRLKNEKQIGSCKMTKVNNGMNLAINFANYGISFTVQVRLNGANLEVNVPSSSIKEVTVGGRLDPKDYKLKSIILFPYLGSQNYLINGYSFIPDGSGALIRYNDHISTTAYIKKLYGDDYGFTDATSKEHIKDNGVLGLPIYGVNHGYNQAAFLCEVKSGIGSVELHAYPYMYASPFNTTFFKYYARDTFVVQLSNKSMQLLNDIPYPSDYSLSYTFLNNQNANYVGMANYYRGVLGLDNINTSNTNIPLRLELLGIDYKPGLFGRNYVKMTSYSDALDIINDLEASNVLDFNITYLGWNSGGFYKKSATNAKASIILGGKKKLNQLTTYLNDHNYDIDYTVNPFIISNYGTGAKNVKRIGLAPFEANQKSSLEQRGYLILPSELASIITKKDKKYNKLNIDALNIDSLNYAYSYRYNSEATYRNEMIGEVVNELEKLDNYKLSTSRPNNYVLKYLTNYYDAHYESNKFIYETDSVPFMSILLSGYINQFMPNINYVSDYDLAVLRMIEYNLYPSFIITKEEAYDLRYTNYEYLNSTQYALWKDLIVKMYSKTNDALKYVIGAKMISHEYVLGGVSKCSYSNGVTIYVNYNNHDVNINDISLAPYSYLVKGGN